MMRLHGKANGLFLERAPAIEEQGERNVSEQKFDERAVLEVLLRTEEARRLDAIGDEA